MLEINGYTLYQNEPNTIVPGGRVYTKVIRFNTDNDFKDRLIRVYLPSTYDFDNKEKRFPVLYMFDGKNLFDDYTSFVGEWRVDEIIEDFISQKLFEGVIVVGIDAPNTNKDRTLEMALPNMHFRKQVKRPEYGYADKLVDYLFNIVKPDIDQTFNTLSDKKNTGVGGSSMGGLMAYYTAVAAKDKLDYALCFSPAFFLYKEKEFMEDFVKPTSKDLPRIYLYVGGVGFESVFVKQTEKVYKYLKSAGYKENELLFQYDSNMEHNEKAWSRYFPSALTFAFKIKKDY